MATEPKCPKCGEPIVARVESVELYKVVSFENRKLVLGNQVYYDPLDMTLRCSASCGWVGWQKPGDPEEYLVEDWDWLS
jgi:hypothetical protein